jgi:dihydropteroate synthase
MSSAAAGFTWRTGRGLLRFDKPCVMGILNVTPDSFFDGGHHYGEAAALHQAERILSEGADVIDIGGESTRPGAQPISASDELARVLPVVRSVLHHWPDAVVSVDTVKSDVAEAVAEEGAAIINDVSGLRLDERVAAVAEHHDLGLVLMHSRGSVSEMARYETANYGDDVVGEIVAELSGAVATARRHNVTNEQIVLDPGLGFSKRTEHSVAALAQLERLRSLGFPILIGASRKRFVGELAGGLPPEERLEATLAANVMALAHGAVIFRVHDVAAARRALDVAHAVFTAAHAP